MLNELYQEVILDHNKRPRNFGELKDANHSAEGYNPLCGDKVTVYLKIKDDKVEDIRFKGSGCAISTASASLMTESLKGKKLGDVQALFKNFHNLVTGRTKDAEKSAMGKLSVFQGVSEFPVRVKCAILAWHTLQAAIEDKRGPVSTE
jgi:nitrogen fixation NifU-like protein